MPVIFMLFKIVKEYNWYQIFEGEELEKLCKEAMKARPKMVYYQQFNVS